MATQKEIDDVQSKIEDLQKQLTEATNELDALRHEPLGTPSSGTPSSKDYVGARLRKQELERKEKPNPLQRRMKG